MRGQGRGMGRRMQRYSNGGLRRRSRAGHGKIRNYQVCQGNGQGHAFGDVRGEAYNRSD